MEELQDAIEDAQYVTAISSVEDGPRPMVVWEIPNEAQLAEWKESVKVLNAKKKDASSLPTPFEFEWTLSHALGLFLFSAYLKESVGDYVQINFIEEVIRWKSTRGRFRAEKTSFIESNYLSMPSTPGSEPSATTTTAVPSLPGDAALPSLSPSTMENGKSEQLDNVETLSKIAAIDNPPKTQIVECNLSRDPTVLTPEDIQEIRARNSGPPMSRIGVGGKVLESVLNRVEKLRKSPGYESLLKMHIKRGNLDDNEMGEMGNKLSDRTLSRGCATMRRLSLVSHELPESLFDEAEIIVAEDIREKHWAGFQNSEYHTKLLNFLWFHDRTVVEEDFFIIRILGRGGFGLVHACKKGTSGKLYAMKVMNKKRIKLKKAEHLALNERQCLADINSPFVVNLKYAFQSKADVFLILDLMTGGDLNFHLSQTGRFTKAQCLYYGARIILGLQALHDQGYVYRDLKPENCLLGEDGRVKLTDLGLAIKVTPNLHGAAGTRGYWAPEVLRRDERGSRSKYGLMVDWFSFGCCLAEFISGINPFRSQTALTFGLEKGSQTKEKAIDYATLHMDPEFDEKKFDEDAADICQRLLDKNETTRLGANGSNEIMSHPYFSDVNWEDIISDRMLPPFVPPKDVNAASQSDIGAFVEDKAYRETVLSEADEAVYDNWNFTNSKAFDAEVIEFLICERETGKPLLPIHVNTSCGCCIII